MIKDIVVNLASEPTSAEYAISVAQTFGAHLAGVAFAYEPVLPATVMGGMPAGLIESQQAESEKAAKAAAARFEELARRAGISSEIRTPSASLAGAGDFFGRIGRRFDLSVVAQVEPGKLGPEDVIIEAALFESGRPVIVVPYIQKAGLTLDRVVVCWDGSKTAARAIGDAMPFLVRAGAVDLLIVTTEPVKEDQVTGADMGRHLARHDVKLEVKRISSDNNDVGDTILSYIADASADFMVLGGYGHSRLREFIWGGVTRRVLASMTVPVLMSH